MKIFVLFSLLSLLACSQAKQETVKAKKVQAADAESKAATNGDDKSIPTEEDEGASANDGDKAADGSSSDSLKDKVSDAAGLAAAKAKELGSAFDLLKNAASANLSCESASDCSIVEYGSKACGGPEGYLVLSKKNVQVASGIVTTLNTAYTTLSATIQAQTGVVSDCSLALPPTAACVAKVCVKK